MKSGLKPNYSGWIVLLLAGCGAMLPPPPPPKMRTAPAITPASATPTAKTHDHAHDHGPGDGKHYRVKFETTKGDFVVEVHPEWAPLGAQRFKQLVEEGFYDNCKFFRVVPGFVVQWGMNGDPAVNAKYQQNKIKDDKPKKSNKRGTIVFATSGPEARTAQVFVNLKDNDMLDTRPDNFAPFGHIIEGMEEVIEKLTSEYGDAPSNQQQTIAQVGNTFLDERYPNLDYIIKATIVGQADAASKKPAAEKVEPKEPAEPTEKSQDDGEVKAKEADKPADDEKKATKDEG